MFGAVALFIVLLVAMLYLAFVRFRNPPQPRAAPSPVGMQALGGGHRSAWASVDEGSRFARADLRAVGSRDG